MFFVKARTNGRVCRLVPGYSNDEPACFDPVFLHWFQVNLAGRTPRISRIGIAYMYGDDR